MKPNKDICNPRRHFSACVENALHEEIISEIVSKKQTHYFMYCLIETCLKLFASFKQGAIQGENFLHVSELPNMTLR